MCNCTICCPKPGDSGSWTSGMGCQSTVSRGCRLENSSASNSRTSLRSFSQSGEATSTWTVRGGLALVGACSRGRGGTGVAAPEVSSGVVLGGGRSHAAARSLPRAAAALRKKRQRVKGIKAPPSVRKHAARGHFYRNRLRNTLPTAKYVSRHRPRGPLCNHANRVLGESDSPPANLGWLLLDSCFRRPLHNSPNGVREGSPHPGPLPGGEGVWIPAFAGMTSYAKAPRFESRSADPAASADSGGSRHVALK